jgi:predicted ATPase
LHFLSAIKIMVNLMAGIGEELSEILNLVTRHRLVTLTGTGGIGKTSLALALARELRPHFADGVWLAEFSALADPGLVPATVAAAVGLELGSGEASAQRVAPALADRRLLVLDTCEHVIAAAATMAEAMLGASSAPHITAISRERAGGEWVYPVQPLAVPAVDVAVDDDPLRYGAVRLFVERARAAEPHFAPDRRLMTITAAICRRLEDGQNRRALIEPWRSAVRQGHRLLSLRAAPVDLSRGYRRVLTGESATTDAIFAKAY